MPRLTTSLPRSLDADYLLSINHSDLARLLFLSNNLEAAERAYLSALHLRRLRLGDDAYSLARVRNELGELYLKMGRLEEAREYLEDAERVRCRINNSQLARTRLNLARLWEMRGDLTKAREYGEKSGPRENMTCGGFKCQKSSSDGVFKKLAFKACGNCRAERRAQLKAIYRD